MKQEIQEKIQEIERHKNTIQELSNDIDNLSSELILEDTDTLTWLYWESGLSMSGLCNNLGIHTNQINKYITPHEKDVELECGHTITCYKHSKAGGWNIPRECDKCRAEYEAEIYSRCIKSMRENKNTPPEKTRFDRLEELRSMPYHEYLQTPEWKACRHRAMKRAWFKCQLCGVKGKTLNTHHNSYENRGAEKDRDLIVLCEDCHERFSKTKSIAK